MVLFLYASTYTGVHLVNKKNSCRNPEGYKFARLDFSHDGHCGRHDLKDQKRHIAIHTGYKAVTEMIAAKIKHEIAEIENLRLQRRP